MTINTQNLPADVFAYIQAEVGSGKFKTAEEFVAAALRERRDHEQKRKELNALLDEGLRDIEQGNVIEIHTEEEHRAYFESIKQRGRERLNERRLNEGKSPLPLE